MEIVNRTPFSFAPLMGRVHYPAHTATLVVKAGFRIVPGGICEPLEEQPALEGDVLSDADVPECLYEADLMHFKPRADMLLTGTCRAPGTQPIQTCQVTFRVGGWSKTLACIGNRIWEKSMLFTRMGAIEPFTSLPLRWANAFGGPKFAANPAGKGHRDLLLPNIEYPDQLISGAREKPTPAGFGPVLRTWKQRTKLMGTYDKKWQQERWPALPEDFDWGYFNAAPADQQLPGFLRGDEEIELTNLSREHPVLKTRLPGLRVRALLREGEDKAVRETPMNLDTLFVDADKGEVYLVWRGVAKVSSANWPECDRILLVSETLEQDRPLEQLTPLFEEEAEEAEPEEVEPPLTPEEVAQEIDKQVARAEKLAEQYEKQAMQQAKAALGVQGDLQKMIAGPKAELASLEAVINRVLAGNVGIKGPKASDFGVAQMDPRKQPEVAEGMKQLNKPVPKAPGNKQALGAMMKSGEASGGDLAGSDVAGEDLSGADLHDADLSDANFEGANLANVNLSGALLIGAKLAGANLAQADLSKADLTGADLTGATLTGANLADASLEGAKAAGAKFDGVKAAGASFIEATAGDAVFTNADLSNALFSQAALESSDFSEANLADAAFDGVKAAGAKFDGAEMPGFRGGEASDFTGASFHGVNAPGSIWEKSIVDKADFREAILTEAIFPGCKMEGVMLYGANLAGSSLLGAQMAKAQAGNANFHKALLEQADLTGASLVASNFYEAEFLDAKTEGADLTGANLKMTKLEQ